MGFRLKPRRCLCLTAKAARVCAGAVLGWLLTSSLEAWEPLRLTSYPQKTRSFFSLTDTNVPAALSRAALPLPAGALTATARSTDGAIWLGTTQGLVLLDFSAPPLHRVQYLSGLRYLPDDQVEQLLPDDQGGVWARTRSGASHIEVHPLTLGQKAQFFERRVRARHDRYGLVADSALPIAGDLSSNRLVDSDNDGLWTSMYAAAECFRYALTQSPEALANARKSIEAVLFLEEVAGRRGFPARSYIRKGDPMPQGGQWHWTADGQYYWKGDTSSDEIVGHFFIFGIAFDLFPDAAIQQRIAATARRILDHILDHHYTLCDLEGKPTTWGWWGPEELARQPDERALNSLEWLSFLKTGAHITHEPRYDAEYRKAAWEFKYADWITRLNEFRQELNYSDEELAMLPFYCLFRYETDPALLRPYRQALDQWWQNIRREANPLWTFIYLLGQPDGEADLAAALWTLSRMPMDTIQWTVRNSNRRDLVWSQARDRSGQPETLTLLPPDERPVMKWNSNPFVVDGGSDGHGEDDGAAFLLPYWLGRHHGFLIGE
jgi:hypothetical protein